MASSSTLPQEDLTCTVCMDIFKDPVILKCSHSFCKACLHKWWDESEARKCPVCQRESIEDPTCNRDLKNLCEAMLKCSIKKPASASELLCGLYGEKLKLFCLDDEEPICVICSTSEEIDQAVRPLQRKLEAFNEAKQETNEKADAIKSQAECTVIQIQKEFEILHQYLRDEEAARISAVMEEEEQKSQRMKERVEKMTKEISSLSDIIRALEEETKTDDISFLQNYKDTKRRSQYKATDPDHPEACERVIDVARHLGNLKYRVWEKMQKIVHYTPITLDPNLKGTDVTLSEDLTTLRYCGETKPSSESDCKDEDFGLAVGSEGFSSGNHSWDVDVGENPIWGLGVAEKSLFDWETDSGELWAINLNDGEYGAISRKGKDVQLKVKREVQRVRVQLDWDRGRLLFSDSINNTSLHTFKQRFTEAVLPLFLLESDSVPLRICPMKISITVG